jgi:hypothetical protein
MKTHFCFTHVRALSLALPLLCLPACASSSPPATQLRAQITAEIGDAACTAPDQCRTLPLGHKACGGPEAYAAYSTARSDSDRLARLATELADARRQDDRRAGMVSTCSRVRDPGATCSAQRCILTPRKPDEPAVQ